MGNKVTVSFVEEKMTKNTVRFQEVASSTGETVIGVLYVQQHTLKNLGYKKGQELTLELAVGK